MTSPLSEQMARRVRVAAGPHDNPDMSVQQVVSAMAARIAELESALSECAASLAWNCFGECRAVHDGPIMPAQTALEHARTALSQPKEPDA